MRRTLLALALTALGFSGVAQANTISPGVYNLYDAYVAGYSVTGTLNLKKSGEIASSHLTFNDPNVANTDLPLFNVVDISNTYNGLSQNYLTTKTSSGQIALYFNTIADANGNLDLCLGSAQCGTSPGTINPSTMQIYGFYNPAVGSNPGLQVTQFMSGYLSQDDLSNTSSSSVVSEPLSVLLVGTGILGLAGAMRLRRS
ncbi:MAG TPA: hypothetical protein VFS41_08145 [Edaphobacter sp.]|nr:hypothetical protein [Edaphobacter sp.]